MSRVLLLLLSLIFSLSLFAQDSFDFYKHFNTKSGQNNADFIKDFPYGKYLEVTSFINFQKLQEHRYFLWKNRGGSTGDDFIYSLADHFLKFYPIDISNLEKKATIGEAYLSDKKEINHRVNEIYKIIGYYILGKIGYELEQQIKNSAIDPDEDRYETLILRLKDNKVYVNKEISTTDKFWDNVKKGNVDYITDRIKKEIEKLLYDPSASASLTMKPYRNMLQISPTEYAVNIFRLQRDNEFIGHSIWLQKEHLKARYFAYPSFNQSVYSLYQSWKSQNNKQVYIAATGGFTNDKNQPVGLTIENGGIVNAVLQPEMDGMVIIYATGGIVVSNLEEGNLSLGGVKRLVDPRKSIIDYSTLVNWCAENKATLFQTQLLAYNDTLLIDKEKAPVQIRERRILVLAEDKKTKVLHNIIFDDSKGVNLADFAEEIFKALALRNKRVIAMLNLDVGSKNILNVFDDNGVLDPNILAPTSITEATNLLVYTK